ncbi:MAG: hypothetical protein IGS03_01570 [Candidatus Sericytochromatia bacterium]|nr:hypothetical protein [Candidatus Sericytochromatia bacterium]
MSEITPIQSDAFGAVTFEKSEQIVVTAPDLLAPEARKPLTGKTADALNLSLPMRKHLLKRKTYFKQAPSAQEQLQRAQTQPDRQGPQQIS